MSKGIQIIKENNNLAEWPRQVEECCNNGLRVRSWYEQHQIAVSTYHYRQQTVWKELQKSSQFVEISFSFNETHNTIAKSVTIGSICAEVHNDADEATLQVLKTKDKPTAIKSYMWLYRASGCCETPIVLYDCRPN